MPKAFVGVPSMFRKISGIENIYAYYGLSRFSVRSSLSHSAGNFRGHSFKVSEKFGCRNYFCIIGVSPFFGENFLSHSAEKIRGHSLNVSENIGYRKILCILRVSPFSVENCLSHSDEKFCKGILLFLRKFLVSKSFSGWKDKYQVSPSKIFRSHSAEKLRGPLLNVSESLG